MAKKFTKFRGGFNPAMSPMVKRATSFTRQMPATMPAMLDKLAKFQQTPTGQAITRRAVGIAKEAVKRGVEKLVNPKSIPHSTQALFYKKFVGTKGTGVTTSRYYANTVMSAKLRAFLDTCQKKINVYNTKGKISSANNTQISFSTLVCDGFDMTRYITDTFIGSGSFDTNTSTSQLSAANLDKSTYIGASHCKLTISSFSESNIVVTIYDIIAKHDMASSGIYQPERLWEEGLDVMISGTLNTDTVIGIQPNQSPLFNTYWAVTNRTNVYLAAGGTHEHTLKFSVNTGINQYRANINTLLGHVTRGCLVVIQGTPVRGGAGETTEVATGTSDINWVWNTCTTSYTSNKANIAVKDYSTYDSISQNQIVGNIDIEPDNVS